MTIELKDCNAPETVKAAYVAANAATEIAVRTASLVEAKVNTLIEAKVASDAELEVASKDLDGSFFEIKAGGASKIEAYRNACAKAKKITKSFMTWNAAWTWAKEAVKDATQAEFTAKIALVAWDIAENDDKKLTSAE